MHQHDHDRYGEAKKITVTGAVINFLLGCIKVISGIAFHSHALVADGLHSFADLLTDFMVIFASRYGSQDADATHPYGHKRIETATTFILSLLLIVAGGGIAWDSLYEIINKQHTLPEIFALPVAILSTVANEALFYYTRRVGERIKSDLIIANAWHHRSDAASSAVVVIGLTGSLIGWTGFDALAAVIVGGMIIQMGWSYGWNSLKELVDTAVDTQAQAEIRDLIQNVEGVQKIHQLRTRMMGGDVYIDVHIQVSPAISVSEGHFIAQHVHHRLVQQIERVKDVTVHVDPEDDEISEPSLHLPNRQAIELEFLEKWRAAYPGVQHWVLHYLKGKVSVDLICNQEFKETDALTERIQQDLTTQTYITSVRLLRHAATLAILRSNKT